ncbi:MAG: ferric reductase-like transmembrane domain-containing protein [Actinomycetota bacterium]|nr:ferric reductase-like transmembrane domain-containing protein [Actinomycetota bacterium]
MARPGGRLVVGLVLLHVWAATVAWAQSRQEGFLPAAWNLVQLPGLAAATLGTLLMLAAALVSVRAARRRLPYEVWHGLHLLLYAAVALSFAHQLAGPDLAGHPLVQVAWALLHTHVFALVLWHRVLVPLRQAARHQLRVLAVLPDGAVTAARRTQRDVLLMAGGVGITPMRALFETLPLEPGQDLTLLYRARCAEDVVFRAELDEIVRRGGARVVYVLGDQPDGLTAESLLRLVPGLPERDVFLCAPPGMSAVVRRALDQAGLAHQQLHEERFVF